MRPIGPLLVSPALAIVLLVGIVPGGCSRPADQASDEVVVYDFVDDLDVAEFAVERSRIRVIDPAFGVRAGDGWGPVETGDDGGSHRWTVAERAELDLFVTRPRDVVFVCRCDSLRWPDAPTQTIWVEMGDFRSPPVELVGAETEIPLPANAWQPGHNRLVLAASRVTTPASVISGSEDERTLALRVEAVELRGLVDADPPASDGTTLRLPLGSAAISYGQAAGQRWHLEDVERLGDARLGVYLRTSEGRVPLQPGRIDVSDGKPMALELVAEPAETPWWRRILGDAGAKEGAIEVRRAQVLLPADRLPVPAAVPEDVVGAVEAPVPKGVILYMIDTLRADRLGAYGSERGLTPHLDTLASEAVVFTEARAQTSWTRPAVASIFTGLYPQGHGIADRDDGLSMEIDTLAERLYESGFATAGYITNGNVSHRFGLEQGFGEYKHLQERKSRDTVHILADRLNEWGLHWLDGHVESSEQPFFLYLHATDPHSPYTPREPFASRFAAEADPSLGSLEAFASLREGSEAPADVAEQLEALYDAEVAWTDAQLGSFFEDLRQRGLWDDVLLIVVSDHGEEFLEHGGWEHGRTLFDEQLKVPLLVKPPGNAAARRVGGAAGHVDLLPTVLDAFGISYEGSEFSGRSLWPAVTARAGAGTGAVALAHLELADNDLRSLVWGDDKLIVDLASASAPQRLFDLAADPGEHADRAPSDPLWAGLLHQELRRLERDLRATARSSSQVELDEETRKQLEALGYAGD